MQAPGEDGAPGSRCFVVCGKSITQDELQAAFQPYGLVAAVKVVREKGVAYVKYDRASSAALAIESLNGAVLNNGRGPKLKVLLADAPSSRTYSHAKQPVLEPELASDPDNVPPRSRLFVVVPKQADPQAIKDDFIQFTDLEYCKTDLIAHKGVVFCKFSRSSSALHALEAITETGAVAGYKVKVMLAEPKTKRIRDSPHELVYGMQGRTDYVNYGAIDALKLSQINAGLGGNHMNGMGLDNFSLNGLGHLGGGLGSLSSLANNMNSMNSMNGMNNGVHGMGLGLSLAGGMNCMNNGMDPMMNGHGSSMSLSSDMHLGAQGLGIMGGLGSSMPHSVSVSPNNLAGMQYSKQRLFIVVHKGVSDDVLARLFRRFPGMEYCDLKKDRATGKSKGYGYVNYSTADAASDAVTQLNGVEFPSNSGHRIKVMYAEPLGTRAVGSSQNMLSSATVSNASTLVANSMNGGRSPGVLSMPISSSAVHTPMSRSTVSGLATSGGLHLGATPHSETVTSISDSLAGMSLHHLAVGSLTAGSVHGHVGLIGEGVEGLEQRSVAHMISPLPPTVARELIYQ